MGTHQVKILKPLLASPLVHVVGARAITFPITVVCGLLWLRLVIGELGPDEYAFAALIIGLQFLLGFLDFGTGANVLEAAGQFRVRGDVAGLGRVLGASWRTIIIGNLLLLVGALGLHAAGLWGTILGFPDRSSTAGVAVLGILAVNALVRPLSLSTALVAGLGRPAIATWAQALTSMASLALVAILVSVNAPTVLIPMTPIAGQLFAYSVPFIMSIKTVPGLMKATARGMRPGSGSGQNLRRLAVPMLLIQIIAPLNDQLDRLVLSHLSTIEALAVFSLGAQLLASADSFLTALTPALWAEFAELRTRGGPRAAVARSITYIKRLWILGVLMGGAFSVLSYTLAPWISGGRLHLPLVFCIVLGAALPVGTIGLLLGLGLTDPRSIRVQPVLLAVTTAINLVLTILLAARLAAVGPALASLIAMLIHVTLLSLLARRRLREEEPRHETSVGTGSGDSLASRRET